MGLRPSSSTCLPVCDFVVCVVRFSMNKNIFNKEKLLPLVLLFAVVLLDQVTKVLVVKYVPFHSIAASFFGDFLRIIYVANTGVAFSIGAGWGDLFRILLFRILPLVVLVAVLVFYFKTNEITSVQRWAVCGIVGGGFGNLIDRFFRPEGVVDFIDVKFYGIFGYDRWPTFNVADAAVVVCGVILVVSFIFFSKKKGADDDDR